MTARVPDHVSVALDQREPLFHTPSYHGTLAETVDADFWEVGASGTRYDRETVLAIVTARGPRAEAWEKRDVECRCLGAHTYLYTYTLVQDQRVSRRASVWREQEGKWSVLYHQGTLVEAEETVYPLP